MAVEKVQQLLTDNIDLWTGSIEQKSSAGRGSSRKQKLHGIKKLRELILELAVRGKLVPQNANDEPAAALLERIAAVRDRLVKEKKIKKPKRLPVITDEEKPFELPDGWGWCRLGDISSYGQTDKAEAADVSADTWVLELEDVEKITSKLILKVRYKDRNFKSSKNRFDAGDVIYGKLRPYLDKVLVADESGVCTTEMIPIRPYGSVEPRFMRLMLKSPFFIMYANNSTHGMNLPRLGTDKARLAVLPLVPENEQRRIVAKVDELMTLCDQLEQQTEQQLDAHQQLVDTLLGTLTQSQNANELSDNWARLNQHFDTLFTTVASIDQLKQTVLQLAVMGKLVPQNPNDEPASALLERIAVEKAQLIKEKKIKKQKLLPPISDEEKPFELPEGWEWCRFAEYTVEIATGPFGSMINKREYITDGIPLVNPSHMIDGRIVEDEQITVTKNKADELTSYIINKGDVVMARRGEMGRCAIVTNRENGWLCGTGSFALKFTAEVDRDFVFTMFSANSTRRYLGGESVGATMTNLNHGILNKMPLMIPPVKEQHRIVTKVNELFTLCDQLKERLRQNQRTQLLLTDTLVQEALSP